MLGLKVCHHWVWAVCINLNHFWSLPVIPGMNFMQLLLGKELFCSIFFPLGEKKISLCNLGWPGIQTHRDLPVSPSWVLGLKSCTTPAQLQLRHNCFKLKKIFLKYDIVREVGCHYSWKNTTERLSAVTSKSGLTLIS